MYKNVLIFLMIFSTNLIQAQASLEEILLQAQKGDKRAKYLLGLKYKKGEDIEQSDKVAFFWLQESAKQGYVKAHYELAKMYYNGEGIFQSYIKAADHYKEAAMQGDVPAQYNLALMYWKGEGVLQEDLIQAYAWMILAASKRKSYIKKKNQLKELIPSDKITEAEKLSKKLSKEIEQRKKQNSIDNKKCESGFS